MEQALALHPPSQDLILLQKKFTDGEFGTFVALDHRTKSMVAVGQRGGLQKGKAWFQRLDCIWKRAELAALLREWFPSALHPVSERKSVLHGVVGVVLGHFIFHFY